MPTYEEVRRSQSSSAPFLGAFLCAVTLTAAPQPANDSDIELPVQIEAVNRIPGVWEADRIIQRISDVSQNQELRDDDEPVPSQQVIDEVIQLIRGAERQMSATMPSAQVSAFFGEINVTWRSGDSIVRLACFPNRPSVIQTGSLSMPIGSYQSEANPTAERLSDRLDSLVPQNDPEEPIFLG